MIRMVLADGSVEEFGRDHPWFSAVQVGLGSLGVITEVTLRTRSSPIYTCRKTAVSADTLEDDLETWNRDNALVKAWWFPQEDQVQVWAAVEASDDEVERYRAGGSELLEHATASDAMNETVDQTLRHLRDDIKIVDENGKPFRTVSRFRDFTDVTGDIYQVFCRGIATPQINVEIGDPAGPRRRDDQEDQGLARRDASTDALSGHPALHRPVRRLAEPLVRAGHLLLRLRRLLLGGRFAVRRGRELPARRGEAAGRRGWPAALGQVLRRDRSTTGPRSTRSGRRSAGCAKPSTRSDRFANAFTTALFDCMTEENDERTPGSRC